MMSFKKAYRKMAKKYHPDKLQDLGEEHLKGAQDKFFTDSKCLRKIKERTRNELEKDSCIASSQSLLYRLEQL